MTRELIVQLLRQNAITITNARVFILSLILNSRKIISHYEIVKQAKSQCNRITVYRTLNFFCEAGLLYKVLDQGSKPHYALSTGWQEIHLPGAGTFSNRHFHFKCTRCGTVECLPTPVSSVDLPEGFVITNANLLLIGQCAACTAATNHPHA